MEQIKSLVEEGKNLALVSDSGTPGISDPGNKLISFLINEGNSLTDLKDIDLKIIPIPGCSALLAAACISGFPIDKFTFLGFPPNKNKRNRFFKELIYQLQTFQHPVIFYESSHRILKTLEEIYNKIPDLNYKMVVCRELTKKFETTYRGTIKEVIEKIKHDKIKGEFTIIIYQNK
jgi:16S rRNA (cytidine1402-2'-O)-methyltransferase